MVINKCTKRSDKTLIDGTIRERSRPKLTWIGTLKICELLLEQRR